MTADSESGTRDNLDAFMSQLKLGEV